MKVRKKKCKINQGSNLVLRDRCRSINAGRIKILTLNIQILYTDISLVHPFVTNETTINWEANRIKKSDKCVMEFGNKLPFREKSDISGPCNVLKDSRISLPFAPSPSLTD